MLTSPLVSLASAAAISLCAAQMSAQQLNEGFQGSVSALPAGAGNVLTINNGKVYFDGFDLTYDGNGSSSPFSLLSYASYTFGSFSVAIGSTEVLFGESSNGGIWKLGLNGQAAQQIGIVPFNYDAVMLDDDRALVSAKTGGFSAADNDIIFVDVLTGLTQLVAQFDGASGPLAIDAAGDIYYATAPSTFPAPPGTVSVLRLNRALVDTAIANNTVLGANQAQVVITGLDAAGDLAFDDDGDLFYVDWMNGKIGEINDAEGSSAFLASPLIDYAGSGLSSSVLQFQAAASGLQVFEPFQPAGGQLLVHETDYGTISQIQSVSARRPELTSSANNPVPAGNFSLTTDRGPANGLGLLAFVIATPSGTVSAQVPGFEQPLLLDGALSGNLVLIPQTFDANGVSTIAISNPGFAALLDTTAQTVCFSQAGALGTSQALALQIGQ